MSVPDEAVVAAWEAFCDGKDDMQAALEAAAPFIAAQAWEEGWAHYRMHFSPNDSEYGANPYRSEQ